MTLRIYNSRTRSIEPFVSHGNRVGVYTCGPTVYDYVTIGNWRTYTLGDLVVRTLIYNGYSVDYYMNITDVGHLTGDNEGDADTGEDRMEKAIRREGKTAWDIAQFYADDFKEGYAKLNLSQPEAFLEATKHIQEQIELVEKLEKEGLAYKIDDGIYFDTNAYEEKGFTYGELSDLDKIQEGARVAKNEQKRNPRDFALWKFGSANRDMLWPSPWGDGFPGWHIECSAMSMKYLGEQFDIHIGGEDLKSTHHPNEIAQSQGGTGKSPFVHYWLHGAFLQVDGGKMGKSLGNAYTLHDIQAKGFSPSALRYFYLTAHYKSPLNFTWEALEGASNALGHLYEVFQGLPKDQGVLHEAYAERFRDALNDDLNTPKALAILWELIKESTVTPKDKRVTLLHFDTVLGLGLDELAKTVIPQEVRTLVARREEARLAKDWSASDTLRDEILRHGYSVKDTASGPIIVKIQ